MELYFMVETTRSIGMVAGPIPVTAIFQIVDRYALGEEMVYAIQQLDAFSLSEAHGKTGNDKNAEELLQEA